MHVKIKGISGRLKGSISPPTSKSQTTRALFFASLSEGTSHIISPLHSTGITPILTLCRLIGAHIIHKNNDFIVTGVGGKIQWQNNHLDVKNSGLALRFGAAAAALSDKKIYITGDHSITTLRPMAPLLSGLNQLGCHAHSLKKNGFAPIEITGKPTSFKAIVSGEDSQTVSALLIVLALSNREATLQVVNPGELPWVYMTLDWLEKLGVEIKNDGGFEYVIKPREQSIFKGFNYQVASDISSTLFPLAASLMTRSSITLKKTTIDPLQKDSDVLDIFRRMGAKITIDQENIYCDGAMSLKGVDVNVNDCIDALPILAVVACYAEGVTRIRGAQMARFKECDRIHAMSKELKKMGAAIEEKEDGLIIKGTQLRGASLSSYKDHRIAMALSCAALGAVETTYIEDVGCVDKTYPGFFNDMIHLGANITQF